MASVAAIVLTGGESRRMGTDKASLVVDGATMLDYMRSVLRLAGISRVVVAGSSQLPDPDLARYGPRGPLAGIVSGWAHLQTERGNARHGDAEDPDDERGDARQRDAEADSLESPDPVVVLACDLPALTPDIISQLVSKAKGNPLGAIAHDGERPQPLVAAYRPAALDRLTQAFEAGERSVRRCFTDWDLEIVAFDPRWLADADTPEDLASFDVTWPNR